MAHKKNQDELRIKFEDGSIRNIVLSGIDDWAQQFLEGETGLICGVGDLYVQTVGLIFAWKCNHGPDDELAEQFMTAAQLMIIQALSEKYAGYPAIDQENSEFFVYIPTTTGELVINASNVFEKMVFEGDSSFADKIYKVTSKGKKLSIDELREQLKSAIEEENYELAAKLRNKLSKRKK